MKNILLITADQFRYDALGCLGKFPVETPNLDRLVADGTIFNNAYCPNPLCVPSRSSIMTGKLCCEHGAYYNDQRWPDALPTLPGVLADNGYYCIQVGKTHFQPNRRHAGFQKMYVCGDYHAELEAAGYKRFSVTDPKDSFVTKPVEYPEEWYRPAWTATKTIGELEQITQRRKCKEFENEAFFMWTSFTHPHNPCYPPEPYFSMYLDKLAPPVRGGENEVDSFASPVRRWYNFWRFIDDDMCDKLRAYYLADITFVDKQIGRIMDKLDELEIRDNTIVIFTSDHGDYMGDHYMQQKGFFHNCASMVPLIFNGPGIPEQSVDAPVNLIDLMPTLLDMENLLVSQLKGPDGKCIYPDAVEDFSQSLKPVFNGGGLDNDRVTISESGIHGQHIMVRQHNVKFNYYANTGEWDWFDLEQDPNELKNLREKFARNDLPAAMKNTLDDILARQDKFKDGYYSFGRIRKMFT